MFSALKQKALSRVEALKNLDSLCDDKQKEAAAADAATRRLLQQLAAEKEAAKQSATAIAPCVAFLFVAHCIMC